MDYSYLFKIVTDSFMQVEGTPPGTVFAIGDCADIKGQPLPCTAQVNRVSIVFQLQSVYELE